MKSELIHSLIENDFVEVSKMVGFGSETDRSIPKPIGK